MNKGFWLSFDAMLALVILLGLFFSIPVVTESDFTELVILQKQHDLVKVWQSQKTTSISEMQKNLEFVFPSQNFFLEVNEQTTQKEEFSFQLNASSIQTIIFVSAFQKISVKLTVYY